MNESLIIERIKQKLNEIEKTENIKILHCVESGSRAWGFASPDSDFDVRFIHCRPVDFYLKLEKTSDVINWELNDIYDINGWDIKKALGLLHKSNPTLFEWNNSPIVYKTSPEWEKVGKVIDEYFCLKSGLYHYLSTARHHYKAYFSGEEVKLKKYFYVIRPLLACRWIIDYGTPPPMLFSELVNTELENDMKPFVDELLERKMRTSETGIGKHISELDRYIEREFKAVSEIIEKEENDEKNGWEGLDRLFLELLRV